MRSTPRHETITLGGVTGTVPPNGPHDPPVDPNTTWHRDGAFYLNSMQQPPQPPRRWPGWVIALIAVGAVFVLGLAGAVAVSLDGGTTPTAATASPTGDTDGMGQPAAPTTPAPRGPLTVQLGETIIYTAEGLGADDEVHYTLAVGKQISRTKYGTRPEKGQFFSLTLLVNVVKGSAYAYGGDFALIAKDGTVYEADMSHAVDGGLEGTEIRAGQKVSGLVVWDIPAGVQVGAKVELRAGGPGGNQGFWQLP
jgi:hypothetical protein